MTIIPHAVSELFPAMSAGEYSALKADIRENGLLEPITLWRGQLIDGRHRARACNELGVRLASRNFEGSEQALLTYVVSLNLKRRHLSESQRAMVAAKLSTLPQGRPKTGQLAAFPQPAAAALLNVGERSLRRARAVLDDAPDLAPAVERGEMTVTEAGRQIKERGREQRREENRAKIANLPTAELHASGARFATIVIDPPWDFREEGDDDVFGRTRPAYAQMSDAQIFALPVGDLADADCHLYLWITNRSLATGKGWRLAEEWGFRPVTIITWCKPSIGVGNYFRNNTEHLLFAVKGSQALRRHDLGTWFGAPRPRGHSVKPAEAYALIESASPGPYLEMFARSERAGWTAWGEVSVNAA